MSIMAIELSASRILAPYFGTSTFIWTNVIGIIMIALTIGYYAGGKLADKAQLPTPADLAKFIRKQDAAEARGGAALAC
jgi:F420-0:gamma-glutamyl ligase-like protein